MVEKLVVECGETGQLMFGAACCCCCGESGVVWRRRDGWGQGRGKQPGSFSSAMTDPRQRKSTCCRQIPAPESFIHHRHLETPNFWRGRLESRETHPNRVLLRIIIIIMPHATLPPPGFQALILCGPGASFSTFTSNPKDIPKALLPIANRPMVWYPLEWCYRMGVTGMRCFLPTLSLQQISKYVYID